jgi:lactate dehydrogenase-like 2-hydroxyacid dehydrogenase
MHLTTGLKGKTVGIVGLGRIGKEVAKRARAFGMEIAYHGRAEQADVPYSYHGEVAALAAAADYLVLCCPGGDETRHLVNAEVLSALGPKGFLVNIARGSVVDEAALVEAAAGRTIAGAAIDVFEDEPNVPEALLPLDNVVIQPHQASATVETRTAMGDLMIDNLLRHFAGEPVLTPVG